MTLQTSDSRDQSRGHYQTIDKFPKFPPNCLAVSKSNVHGSGLFLQCPDLRADGAEVTLKSSQHLLHALGGRKDVAGVPKDWERTNRPPKFIGEVPDLSAHEHRGC